MVVEKMPTERIINKTVLLKVRTASLLYCNIRRRQANLFGHEMRRKALKYLAITGTINGKRSGERPPEKYFDGIIRWMQSSTIGMFIGVGSGGPGGHWPPLLVKMH